MQCMPKPRSHASFTAGALEAAVNESDRNPYTPPDPCSSTDILEQEERKDDRDLHFLDPSQPARDLEAQLHAQFVGSSRKLLASNSILSRGGCWVADLRLVCVHAADLQAFGCGCTRTHAPLVQIFTTSKGCRQQVSRPIV